MAMAPQIMAASGLAALNVALLAILTAVWLRNYRTFRTTMTLGLMAFGLAMFFENALAIYYFFSMKMLYSGDPSVQTAVLVLRAIQFVALVSLTYVTMR